MLHLEAGVTFLPLLGENIVSEVAILSVLLPRHLQIASGFPGITASLKRNVKCI